MKKFGIAAVLLSFALASFVSAQTLKPRTLAGYDDGPQKGATHQVIPGTNGEVNLVFDGIPNRGADTQFCLVGVGNLWPEKLDPKLVSCAKVGAGPTKIKVTMAKEGWGRTFGFIPVTLTDNAKVHPQGWERPSAGPALQQFYSNQQKKDSPILALTFERDGKTRAGTPEEAKTIQD